MYNSSQFVVHTGDMNGSSLQDPSNSNASQTVGEDGASVVCLYDCINRSLHHIAACLSAAESVVASNNRPADYQ